MILNEPPSDRQTQADAVSPGSKKGLKDTLKLFRRNTRSGVADGNLHLCA